jgi:hypothetical protein
MSRLVLLLCLVALASACGGGGHRADTSRRLPRTLARSWARQADAVAQAANAGDDCVASARAQALLRDISTHQDRVPLRYQRVLLPAVSRIASGLSCNVTTVATTTAPAPQPKPKPKPKPHPPHGPPGHHKHHGHGHGHGGDEGGDG